jgi:hypothetical protein
MKITIELLKKLGACSEMREVFSKQKESDAVKLIAKMIRLKKLDWANWLIVRLLDRLNNIRYAVFAAKKVLGLYERKYPSDDRPRRAIEAAKLVIAEDTEENRNAANSAAYAANSAAYAAYSSNSAAYAAYAASYATYTATYATYAVTYSTSAAYAASAAAANAANVSADAYAEIKTEIIRYGITLMKAQEKGTK